MLLGWDMYECEIKKLDAYYPSVYCRIRLNIWVVQHSFDILCIYLNNQVLHADDVYP